MKYVIIDSRLPASVKRSLSELGFNTIEMPVWERLQKPVSAHPDMLLFIAGNSIITHENYYMTAKKEFDLISSLGYDIILSNEMISPEYPNDILFNCVEIGDLLFGKESKTSSYILDHARLNKKKYISVKQGYAKCSVAKISEGAAVTSDPSLYKAMSKNGIDVLLISQGEIDLKGYDFGFIGGCSGLFEDKVYFSGDLSLHPNAEEIKSFCKKHKKTPVSLSSERLFDGGSLYFLVDR